MELGNVIKNKRNKLQLTQEQLAVKLHVSRQTISKWENNNVVEKISQDVTGKKKYKRFAITLSIIGVMTLSFLGLLSYGHHYQKEYIDLINPFLKTETSYAVMPITNKPIPKKDIYIQNDAFGNGFWQKVYAGIIEKDNHWAMVSHKGSYVFSLKLIDKKYWGYPRSKYETLTYFPYDARGNGPRTSSWNPFH
ncbi:helix-turn-helix transcriptional regulator [Companilactobacillus jidongensis]|uniref:helix-turn-helix transcriptional regulator n=1 Tax=Companilactobacillus jidongensis TaxID=2486006 RepID=UPI000F77E974|nr:helix-turn-helix transcriptional regulator [Companilactobacillus jidongensis]